MLYFVNDTIWGLAFSNNLDFHGLATMYYGYTSWEN
jgi:hypothetical protein